MEKLEPLIRHKFWIIFGLSLPVALFAYFSASGKMAEATTAQESKLDSALSGVPSGAAAPNETYAAGAKVINEDLQKRFDVQVQKLWESQTDRMTWPKIVVPEVPPTYRGTIDPKACYTYMRIYPGVVEDVWERVQPYVGDPKTSRALLDFKPEWPQKVIIDGHNIPHASFDMSAPAESKEVWDAQEDIWLLGLLFDAVARTNKDAQFVSDAPVRQIDKIELVGGSGQSSVTATASAAGAGGDYGGGDYGGGDYGGGGYEEAYASSRGGGRGAGGMGGAAKVAFNVAEEFGQPIPEASDETETASASAGGDYGGGDYGGEDYGGYGGMNPYGGLGAGVKMQRYIGESGFDPFAAPYRERGFYMSVIILQDRIPDFFAELSSSPWPIRLGRFNIGQNPYAAKTGAGGGGYGMGYGGGMAFGGGMGEGDYGGYGGGYGGGEGDYGDYGGGMGGGFGGMGGRAATPLKLPDYMKMPSSISPELRSDPALVQLDFCGIITMYNPVTDDSVEVIDDGSTEEDYQDELAESPEDPEEAKAMAAEAAAAEANAPAEGTPPAQGGTPVFGGPAANPPAGDGTTAPDASPAPDAEPPAEGAAENPAPPAAETPAGAGTPQ